MLDGEIAGKSIVYLNDLDVSQKDICLVASSLPCPHTESSQNASCIFQENGIWVGRLAIVNEILNSPSLH